MPRVPWCFIPTLHCPSCQDPTLDETAEAWQGQDSSAKNDAWHLGYKMVGSLKLLSPP